MKDSDYIPLIRSHYINNIPPAELTSNATMQSLLADIFRAAEAYKLNPFLDLMWYCQKKLQRSYGTARQIRHYVEYIDTNFSTPTRKELQNKALFLADSVAQQALAAGDRQDQIKAAALYVKIGQLDKPEQESDKRQVFAPTDIVFTPHIEDTGTDLRTIEDEELKRILREEGGIIDAMEENIDKKVEILQIKSQTQQEVVLHKNLRIIDDENKD